MASLLIDESLPRAVTRAFAVAGHDVVDYAISAFAVRPTMRSLPTPGRLGASSSPRTLSLQRSWTPYLRSARI